jgi:hypothetical protein
LLMSLGALCVFIWGVLSGAFHGADEAALRFYQTEMESQTEMENDGDHIKQANE